MKKWLMLFFGVVLAWSVAAFDPSQWTGEFAAAEQEYAKGHFAAVIPTQASPLKSFFFSFVLPTLFSCWYGASSCAA